MSAISSSEPRFEPVAAARGVLEAAGVASLATLSAEGHPFASLVTFATMPDLSPVLWLSDLAVHSRNLAGDPRASLLVVAPGGEGGDPLAGARVTLTGTIRRSEDAVAARRFGALHGAGRADFADFHAYRMEITAAHLVAGFGRIHTIGGTELTRDLAGANDLLAGEAMIVDHMNADHAEAIALYATVLLGLPEGDWRISGCDPEGVDLVSSARRARLPFAERATTVAAAGGALKLWAKDARLRKAARKD